MAEKTSVLDCITSFVDGRVRLRHPALKDAATSELVCTVVREVEGITAVETNPRTGSLLIFYDPAKLSREELLGLAEQASAFMPDPDAQEGEAFESPAEAVEAAEAEVPAEKPAVAAEGAKAPSDGLSSAVSKLAELVEDRVGGNEGKGQGGKSGKGGKSGGAGSGKGGGSGRGKGGGGAGGGKGGGGGRGGKSGGASALGILSTVVSTALPGKLPKAIIGGLATTLPKVLNKGFATEASATVSQALPEESAFPRTADELLDMLTSRKATRFVNRGMLVALGVSLAALPLNNKTLHTIAGGVFAGGVLQHLLAHRKAL